MHLVNLTTDWLKRIYALIIIVFICSVARAQDNSPYSRYGVGDVVPNQNMINRGMGGITAGYSDYLSINFTNPASLGNIWRTIFDLGAEIDIRTLKSTNTNTKYTSTNSLFSYFQLGFPLTSKKMAKKGMNWGLSFGLRPLTRIAYKIEKNERLTGIDSLSTLFEGSGGANQFNVSTGFKVTTSNRVKENPAFLSIGLSSGYTFGNRDYSTQKVFINDTVAYYKSNTQAQSHFGGIFLNAGLQYQFPVRKFGFIKLGAYANFQQNLKAKEDNINETFAFDGNGGILTIDTVTYEKAVKGTVKLPATYGVGFTYHDSANHWIAGADFEMTNWDSYRYYDKKDDVQNNWTIRLGAEYFPSGNKASAKYFRNVKYRAGFYLGPDYVKLDKTRNSYAASLGASFPLTTTRRFSLDRKFVCLNTALEIGGRGNKQSFSFRENNLRLSIGISMSAAWFQKRNYQ